ncbi:deoxyhypusine synthase family protein, partial [Thermoproteota archaeon]
KKENSNKKNEISPHDLLTIPVKHSDGHSVSNISELIESLNGTAFQSRNLAKCLDVMLTMLRDPDRPTIFLALAGAMVPGGLRKIVRDMLELNMVDVLVSTGANLYHDVHEALGFHHYLAQKEVSDLELRKHQIDRMFDVYASNEEFLKTDAFIKNFVDSLQSRKYSTREFLNKLGDNLQDENSILKTASKKNISVFCPAIADSSIGLSLAWHTHERYTQKRQPIFIDTILDNLEILKYKINSKKTGAIHIGGGVPKNYIQQIGPMAEILNLDVPSLSYGVQITTDDPKWGGLSGCTFKESQSWGKYTDKAHFSTVYMDATIGLPLLFKACIEKKNTWYQRDPLQVDINKDLIKI